MPTSLFIEHHKNGLAFYLNGDLQFDTADESLYHEYLVIPSVALAVQRSLSFSSDWERRLEGVSPLKISEAKLRDENRGGLRVLICGGGDGLAARDVLRFSEVSHIDLVDYNPEVLDLANTVFRPYNAGSLESDRLTVYVQEAFDFISTIPDNSYHVVICDFTYPTQPEDTSIYSREWFQQVNRILHPSGVMSTNGVSPENRTTGFWCLYQTMLSAGLKTKPLQLTIPSFQRNGYGNWGFLLASPVPIAPLEIEALQIPNNLQALTCTQLQKAFLFNDKIADTRHSVNIHLLDCPQLFYYLLNPDTNAIAEADALTTVDFLDIQESGNGRTGKRDSLQLESIAQAWREQLSESLTPLNNVDLNKLLPVQHRYHSPKMTRAWLSHIKLLLAEIDLSRLLNSLLERSQELPSKVTSELKQLADKIRSGEKLSDFSPSNMQLVMMISITLLVANIVTPDAAFSKGYYGSSSTGNSDSSYQDSPDFIPLTATQSTGLTLAVMGWILLILGIVFGRASISNDE